MRQFIALLPVLLLFACSQQAILEKFSTPRDQATAKAYISDLQAGRFDAIENDLDPSVRTPRSHATLVQMAALLPAGEPTSIKLVGAQSFHGPSGSRISTTFEYGWRGKLVICNVTTLETKAGKTLVGFNVSPQNQSLEVQNRFGLTGKSAAQYAILVGAVLAFCLTVYALVACIRTKALPRKWLWILFILVGFGGLSTNWTTGAVGFQLLSFRLFSAGAFAPLYGPWTITMAAPVGAVVFLWRRRRRTSDRVAAPP